MEFFHRVSHALSWSLVNAARTRARLDLLERDDRFLADNGFSRALLERGNDAWPWRADGVAAPARTAGFVLPPAGARTAMPAELLQHDPARVAVVPASPGGIESRAERADRARAFAAGEEDHREVGTSRPVAKERKAA